MTIKNGGTHRIMSYRSVFLSDFHIGAKSFDAAALIEFLQSIECEYLYLVGDIIDGWKLNKRWYWTEDCSRVLDELARKVRHGTKIMYLPGNHDDEVRRISPYRRARFARRMHIDIRDKAVHTAADGRRFLILHGDQFDRKILKGPLSIWSDYIYDAVTDFFGNIMPPPPVKVQGKVKRFSLAKSLSKHGQWALHLLNNFENAVFKMAKKRGVDGLICGHTHIPVIKNLKGVTYANAGSWLKSGHTALVENHSGKLELLDWPASHEMQPVLNSLFHTAPKLCTIAPDLRPYRRVTLSIIGSIERLWPEKKYAPKAALNWIEIKRRDEIVMRRCSGLASYHLFRPLEQSSAKDTHITAKKSQTPDWQRAFKSSAEHLYSRRAFTEIVANPA